MAGELDPAVAELVKGYPVVVTTMVAWGDMDANRHVNNTVYFRYFEHARLKYFLDIGFSRHQQQSHIGPILAWADCRFRRPLSYPDTVSIGMKIIDTGDDWFMMEGVIVSHNLKDIAARGQQRLVSYDYEKLQKVPLPELLKRKIEAFERGLPVP
jgi:acyl-CoA thioester hydrolase